MKKNVVRYLCILLAIGVCIFGVVSYVEKIISERRPEPDPYEPPVFKVSGKVSVLHQKADTEAEKKAVKDWAENFEEKYPDVQVEVDTTVLSDEAVEARLASGSMADVFYVETDKVYEKKETLNALMSLDDYSETMGINLNAVSPAALAMGRHEGRTYVIMTDYDRRVLVYNKTILDKVSGVSDPALEAQNDNWTWDVFKEYCEKATLRENGNITQVGASLHFGHPAVWLCFAEGFGGSWYDNSEIFFSENEETIKGLNTMVDFVKSGNAVPVFNDDASNVLEGVFCDINASQIIDAGKVYENAGYDWNVVSFPEFESHRSYVTSSGGFGVYKRNNNPDAAAALCLSLCTTEGAMAYNSGQEFCVPAVQALQNEEFWKTPVKEAFEEKSDAFYDPLLTQRRIDRSGILSSLIPGPVAEIVEEGMYALAVNVENADTSLLEMLEDIDKDANECWDSKKK